MVVSRRTVGVLEVVSVVIKGFLDDVLVVVENMVIDKLRA